jgi:exopolysaccharide production protein ExoZ
MRNKMNTENRSLDWVQALRGLASLAVVFCHSRSFYEGTPFGLVAVRWMLPGAIGVDLFFMLSGFIMVYSTVKFQPTAHYTTGFFIKRFSRVWPSYAVFTVAWAVLTLVQTHHISLWDVRVIVQSLLFLPSIPHQVLYYGSALPVGWTLNFEVYFYLIFGLCLLFGRFRWHAMGAWFFATLVLLPLSNHTLSTDVWKSHHFSVLYLDLMANPIIAEFLIGVLIAQIYLNERVRFTTQFSARCWVLLSSGFAIVYTLVYQGPIHGLTNWGWPVALLMLCLAIASKTITLAVPRVLVFFGEISFSLYLVHGFILAAGHVLLKSPVLAKSVSISAFIVLMIAVSIFAAWLSHRLFEQELSDKVRAALLNLRSMRGRGKSAGVVGLNSNYPKSIAIEPVIDELNSDSAG